MTARALLLLALAAGLLSACAGQGEGDLAREALARQDYAAAREHAGAALKQDPADPVALADLARAQLALGQGADALATLERLRRTGSVPPDMKLLLAEGELQIGGTAAALELAGDPPASAEGWRLRALALSQAGRDDKARDAFERGRSADGPRHRLNIAEAVYRLDRGDRAGAKAALARASAEAPEAIEVLFVTARIAQLEDRGDDALAAYLAILDKAPLDRPALLGAIAEHGRRGEIGQLQELVARGIAAMPEDAEFVYLSARLLAERDDWEKVRELLQRREPLLPEHPDSRALYAQALLELGQYESARAHAAPLYRTHPESVMIRRIYARALIETGDATAARAVIAPLVDRPGAQAIDRHLAERASHRNFSLRD